MCRQRKLATVLSVLRRVTAMKRALLSCCKRYFPLTLVTAWVSWLEVVRAKHGYRGSRWYAHEFSVSCAEDYSLRVSPYTCNRELDL